MRDQPLASSTKKEKSTWTRGSWGRCEAKYQPEIQTQSKDCPSQASSLTSLSVHPPSAKCRQQKIPPHRLLSELDGIAFVKDLAHYLAHRNWQETLAVVTSLNVMDLSVQSSDSWSWLYIRITCGHIKNTCWLTIAMTGAILFSHWRNHFHNSPNHIIITTVLHRCFQT